MRLLDFYAPPRCPVCDRELPGTAVCCRDCYSVLLKDAITGANRCGHCYHPSGDGKCGFCGERNVFFDQHMSLFRLSVGWNRVLHRWKFENDRGLFRIFLPSLKRLLDRIERLDIRRIGYIDSGRAGFEVRAYNPCRDIAGFLAAELGLEWGGDLKKKPMYRQSGRGYAERFIQIKNSFEAVKRFDAGECPAYLLVEDVFTTGATANEAARTLKMNGAKSVYILSMLQREELDFS